MDNNETETRIKSRYEWKHEDYVRYLRATAKEMNAEADILEDKTVLIRPIDRWSSLIPKLTRLLHTLDALNEFCPVEKQKDGGND